MLVCYIWKGKIKLYFFREGFFFVFGIVRVVNIKMCFGIFFFFRILELSEGIGKKILGYCLLSVYRITLGSRWFLSFYFVCNLKEFCLFK